MTSREMSSVPDQPTVAVVVERDRTRRGADRIKGGGTVRVRMRGHELHGPAHLEAEVLSALGRLHRAGDLPTQGVTAALSELKAAPIRRHHHADLFMGAWEMRDRLRLVDALYLELSAKLRVALLTTDARLAPASTAELVRSAWVNTLAVSPRGAM
ncbi:MAG: type II toxin-antitoxin system VapC family toxin [Solirubrobacteraceae bacterium]